MPQDDVFCRHDWVYLPDDWRDKLAAPLATADEDALARWVAPGRPLVVARRLEQDAPGLLRLGLALPGKRRVGVVLPAEAVERRRRAPRLLEVLDADAALWPEAMHELAAMVSRAAPDTRVFGSFAWQSFAADSAYVYVTPSSDIDVLLAPAHAAELSTWIALLQNFETRWPAPRLDGEIALPGGDFVAWREFSARPQKILVKGADHVSLRPIEDIDALLSARAA
jgi:malonate decarboxylase holo-[acyl-carrier-protein] synthase